MRRARRRGGQEVEHEVAVGDGVDRVRRDARRSRARAATMPRSVSKFTPASAPAPSGRSATCARAKREALAVARAASRRRRAGGGRGRPAARAGGACSRAAASRGGASAASSSARMQVLDARRRVAGGVAHEQRDVRGDLVVARARGVQLARRPAPAISVTRRSIAMWMSSSSSANGNVPSRELAPRRRRAPPAARRGRRSEMIPRAASMRAWARDCATS